MADFKIPNLCGASEQLNATQRQFDSVIRGLIDGIEDDASTLAANMEPTITELVSNFKAMMPELPALPNINLQAQLTSLLGMTPGSAQYITLLSDITTKFGSALTAAGYSLDTIIKDARTAMTEGPDLCSVCPNFEVDAAGLTDAAEKASAVLHPAAEAAAEELATCVDNENFVALIDGVKERVESFDIGELVPTGNIGPFRIVGDTREIVVSDNQGSAVTIDATTPYDAVATSTATTSTTANDSDAGREERSRANICF